MDTAQSMNIDSETPQALREQIEETRAALGQKLETLETEVRSTVQGAQESVKETVDNVKKAFDVRYHVTNRPWTCIGLAVAGGIALGLASRSGSGHYQMRRLARGGRSSVDWARSTFDPELKAVKAMAIGAAVSFVGELLKEALPQQASPRVSRILSSVSRKMGGDSIEPTPQDQRSSNRNELNRRGW